MKNIAEYRFFAMQNPYQYPDEDLDQVTFVNLKSDGTFEENFDCQEMLDELRVILSVYFSKQELDIGSSECMHDVHIPNTPANKDIIRQALISNGWKEVEFKENE